MNIKNIVEWLENNGGKEHQEIDSTEAKVAWKYFHDLCNKISNNDKWKSKDGRWLANFHALKYFSYRYSNEKGNISLNIFISKVIVDNSVNPEYCLSISIGRAYVKFAPMTIEEKMQENLLVNSKRIEEAKYSIVTGTTNRYKEQFLPYNELIDCIQKKDNYKKNMLYLASPSISYVINNYAEEEIVENAKKAYAKLKEALNSILENQKLSIKTNSITDENNEFVLAKESKYKKQGKEEVKTNMGLNTILYGPPGTGKTYNTVNYAVAILENKSFGEINKERQENGDDVENSVLKRFNRFKNNGQIAFVTFHQSYGYEEFIEGIKPVLSEDDSKSVYYDIIPGSFKEFCDNAKGEITESKLLENYGINSSPVVWKVSLAKTGPNEIRTDCLANNYIRVGYDSAGPDINDELTEGKNVLNAFANKMKIGDIVFSCYSESEIDAIGVVEGEYFWNEDFESYKRCRKVNWIRKNIRENIVNINGNAVMTLPTVYKLRVTPEDAIKLIYKGNKNNEPEIKYDYSKKYVYIIDEINRGNISKIFGELITLIEPPKRLGNSEEIECELPYSGEKFGVPKNVYILGTMNTADRSIALMDTALRRRFDFVEMMPDLNPIRGIRVGNIEIDKMLDAINKRIEVLYDREHTLGHAFFIPLRNNATLAKLAYIFENKIIPLLQEYFYEDYEKIQLVLADNTDGNDAYKFIKVIKVDAKSVFKGKVNYDDLPEKRYVINKDALKYEESFIKIYS